MRNSNLTRSLTIITCLWCLPEVAVGQTAAPAAAPAPPSAQPAPGSMASFPPAAQAPAAQAPAAQASAAQAPAAAAPAIVVPPGYALVPIQNNAQIRYDAAYLPPPSAPPPDMELPYEEGEPVPDGYRVVKQTRRGLVIAGSIVGGIAYGFSVTAATGDDFEHKSGALLVPVLGPWIMLALGGASDECQDRSVNGVTYNSYDCDHSDRRALLVLDGLTQGAGAVMFIAGLAYPKMQLQRKQVSMSMAPMPFGNGGYGIGAVGRF